MQPGESDFLQDLSFSASSDTLFQLERNTGSKVGTLACISSGAGARAGVAPAPSGPNGPMVAALSLVPDSDDLSTDSALETRVEPRRGGLCLRAPRSHRPSTPSRCFSHRCLATALVATSPAGRSGPSHVPTPTCQRCCLRSRAGTRRGRGDHDDGSDCGNLRHVADRVRRTGTGIRVGGVCGRSSVLGVRIAAYAAGAGRYERPLPRSESPGRRLPHRRRDRPRGRSMERSGLSRGVGRQRAREDHARRR